MTKTGINFFPLWTAKVNPTISGMMVDRLDQVLITLVSFVLRASVTLLITWESTKSPFLIERAINLSSSVYIYQCSYFFGSSSPIHPTACKGVVLPNSFPRLRPEGGRSDSWPPLERWASHLAIDFFLLFQGKYFHAQGCSPGQWWHNNPGGLIGLHRR